MRPPIDSENKDLGSRGTVAGRGERDVVTDVGVQVQKLLVTVVEASEVLGVGRSVVYELMNSARLPSVSIGRSRRIRVSDLEDFVAALTTSRR